MANAETYTVQKGDTLSEIAAKHGTTVAGLQGLNAISDPNLIYVGQVLRLHSSGGSSGSGSSSSSSKTKTTTTKAVIDAFGLQSNTDRTVFATWTWGQSNTKQYQAMWYYDTGDGVWFVGNDHNVTEKQSTYNAPTNAKKVKFKVKPISETRTVNNKDTAYWTATWSEEKTYDFSNNPPGKPNVPEVTLDKYTLTAKLDNIDLNAERIQFQVIKDNTTVYKTGTDTITVNYAAFSCTVTAGSEYKVRCRSYKDKGYGEWSEFSNPVRTIPSTPSKITVCKASSSTSIHLEWSASTTADTYDLQYTTKKEYFDGSDQLQSESGIESTQFEKTGLEHGNEYFFRVRAVNGAGESPWSEIKSVVLGKEPAAPTTWSSTTTVVTGEMLTLYWVHNAEDGSSQTYAELELNIDGKITTRYIRNSTEEDEKDKTSFYNIDTKTYTEGSKILWRVRTKGVTNVYGDWSIQRTVDIYAPASLELSVTNSSNEMLDILETFPIKVAGIAGPNTQQPISYHLSIIANEAYDTVDATGSRKFVSKGESVYSRYFDISEELSTELSAGDVDLENNIEYTIVCKVSMNSGLTAESSLDFVVSWTDEIYEPNCELSVDTETYTASIRPYCADEEGRLLEDVLLSVYRREFNGGFVELGTGIDNLSGTFITDPHPALDYARYRIVAMSKATGAVSYYDVPGYPVGGIAAILQWDEEWTTFDVQGEDAMEKPIWAGSMLKLPYNIDVVDDHRPDVSLVEYIGREHPVSYYGTQVGATSTWSMDIPKNDEETLYALRRLANWMGDVYVREPSGSGYWANVVVSFSQRHCEVVIPVSIDVTRVEGGA